MSRVLILSVDKNYFDIRVIEISKHLYIIISIENFFFFFDYSLDSRVHE